MATLVSKNDLGGFLPLPRNRLDPLECLGRDTY
jgi:hypothetical protein